MLVRPELNSRPPTWQPGAQPTEPLVRGLIHVFPHKVFWYLIWLKATIGYLIPILSLTFLSQVLTMTTWRQDWLFLSLINCLVHVVAETYTVACNEWFPNCVCLKTLFKWPSKFVPDNIQQCIVQHSWMYAMSNLSFSWDWSGFAWSNLFTSLGLFFLFFFGG